MRCFARPATGTIATGYLAAVRQFGSPALSLPELRELGELVRDEVDAAIADANGIAPAADAAPRQGIAGRPGERPDRGVSFKLPPGGAVLRSSRIAAPLVLGRFGAASAVQAGQLIRGQWMALSVPSDSAPDPWYASTSATPLLICGPPPR